MLNNSINENPPSYEEVLDPNSKLAINITLIEQPLQTNIPLIEQPQNNPITNQDLENPTNDKCLPNSRYNKKGNFDVPYCICISCIALIFVPLCAATCGCCGNIWLPNK